MSSFKIPNGTNYPRPILYSWFDNRYSNVLQYFIKFIFNLCFSTISLNMIGSHIDYISEIHTYFVSQVPQRFK